MKKYRCKLFDKVSPDAHCYIIRPKDHEAKDVTCDTCAFAEALTEPEPKYKVGDWVVMKNKKLLQVKLVHTGGMNDPCYSMSNHLIYGP